KNCLTVPVVVAGERLGVLAAFSALEMAFKREAQRLVEAVFRHIAPILERLRPSNIRPQTDPPAAEGLEWTPVGMIGCRCASTTAAGTETVGIALAVVRRHLAADALTQIVHGNDIFIGIGVACIDTIDDLAERLRHTLTGSGLIDSARDVAVAVTPRDGTT